MKKIITILSIIAASVTGFSQDEGYNLNYFFYYFYDKNGNEIQDRGSYALVVYTSDIDISSFSLNTGDTFSKNDWLNSDSNSGIYVIEMERFYNSEALPVDNPPKIYNSSLPEGLNGNENLAVIAWQQPSGSYTSSVMEEGATYTVYAPSMSGGNTGQITDAWQLVPDGDGKNFNLYLSTVGGLDKSYTTLSQVVVAVPEPSAYAAVFGAIALSLGLIRRKK